MPDEQPINDLLDDLDNELLRFHRANHTNSPMIQIQSETVSRLVRELRQRIEREQGAVESFRQRAINETKKLQIGGLSRAAVYTMLYNLEALPTPPQPVREETK